MKQELFNLYNELKNTFIEKIVANIEGGKIEFSPYIRISLPRDSDEFFEEILSIEYDANEKIWYAHNCVTETDCSASMYWTPLRDLSFDELYKIAERL